MKFRLAVLAIGLACSTSSGAWVFEDIDASIQSRGAVYVGVAADGMVVAMYSGNTDGMSCDGTADVYLRARIGPNNWVDIPASYTPSRLRCTRPHMVVDTAGNIYIVFEYWWAYYTGVMKFVRTGPTTWVRDGSPAFIRAPGITPCGTTDPNLPSNYWVYGYNPRIAVAPNGSLSVVVNPNIGSVSACFSCYNSGADWRSNWQVAEYDYRRCGDLVADQNSDFHFAMSSVDPWGDPNLADNIYLKTHNGTPVIGPTTIGDGGARTGESSIGVAGASVYLASMEWNLYGNGTWNLYQWTINGTTINAPSAVTSPATGLTAPRVAARNSAVRYFYRTDASDARWAWYMVRPGVYTERISLPGHDTGDMHPVFDASNNLHVGISDWDAVRGNVYVYGYKASDEPPPGPHGTFSGVVRDQNNGLVPNATITTQNGIVTVTDSNGNYALQVPAGTYTLTASKAYYNSQSSVGLTIAVDQTIAQDFSLVGAPPGPLPSLTVATGNTSNLLQWTNPTSGQYSGTRIVAKIGAFPSGPGDGTVVVDEAAAAGSQRMFTHSGLTNGQFYCYAAYAYYQDGSRFYSTGVQATGAPAVPSDFDHDGDVDSSDWGLMQACLTGPYVPQVEILCGPTMLDQDNDVDVDDVTVFVSCFRGSGVYAPVNCGG